MKDCRESLGSLPDVLSFGCTTVVRESYGDVCDFDVGLHVVLENHAAHDAYHGSQANEDFVARNEDNWKQVCVFDSESDLLRRFIGDGGCLRIVERVAVMLWRCALHVDSARIWALCGARNRWRAIGMGLRQMAGRCTGRTRVFCKSYRTSVCAPLLRQVTSTEPRYLLPEGDR